MRRPAIDRFRLSARDEKAAQEIAAAWADSDAQSLEARWGRAMVLNGWLTEAIAQALERPRWASRRRLAIDLRVAEIVRTRGQGS